MQLLIMVLIIKSVLTLGNVVPGTESLSPTHEESSMAERDTVSKAVIEDMMASLRAEIKAKIHEEIEADYRQQVEQRRSMTSIDEASSSRRVQTSISLIHCSKLDRQLWS